VIVRGARITTSVVMIAALAAGCGQPPDRRTFTVGTHRVSTITPLRWEVLEHGEEILIRNGDEQVAIADLGPAGPAGIRRQVERARDLWRAGRDRDARWRMSRTPVPDDLFETAEQRKTFWLAWSDVSNAPEGTSAASIERPFETLLQVIETMPDRSLDQLVDHYLAGIDRDQQRDVASRQRFVIRGREMLVVDTWDRMAHRMRQRTAFVLDEGDLLALRTDRGRFGENAQVLAVMLAALRVE
jgi:hypothetical protein